MKTWGLFLLGLFLTGCATMINGQTQTITVMSEPSEAAVTVNGESTGKRTPAELKLKRGVSYSLLVEKEGYKPQTLTLKSRFSHLASLGNIWNFVLPGLIVDVTRGGAYEFDQRMTTFTLAPDEYVDVPSPHPPPSPSPSPIRIWIPKKFVFDAKKARISLTEKINVKECDPIKAAQEKEAEETEKEVEFELSCGNTVPDPITLLIPGFEKIEISKDTTDGTFRVKLKKLTAEIPVSADRTYWLGNQEVKTGTLPLPYTGIQRSLLFSMYPNRNSKCDIQKSITLRDILDQRLLTLTSPCREIPVVWPHAWGTPDIRGCDEKSGFQGPDKDKKIRFWCWVRKDRQGDPLRLSWGEAWEPIGIEMFPETGPVDITSKFRPRWPFEGIPWQRKGPSSPPSKDLDPCAIEPIYQSNRLIYRNSSVISFHFADE